MRAFVFGLDGGTWRVFNRMIDQDVMPFLGQLREEGSSGILESTIPPITPVAWSSFQTGCEPVKHGVMGFANYDRVQRSSYYVSSETIRLKTLWELVSETGGRVISIDVPLTYPIRPINGAMISGFMTPSDQSDRCYPPDLLARMEKKIGAYEMIQGAAHNQRLKKKETEEIVRRMLQFLRQRTEACLYLLRKEQWDLFMVHFQPVDIIQHMLWHYIDPDHPEYDDRENRAVLEFYRFLDDCLKRIFEEIDKCGDEYLAIVLSDHGFQNHEFTVNITRWLSNNGLLHHGRSVINASLRLARTLDRWNLRNRFFGKESKSLIKTRELRGLDWEKSKVIPRAALYASLFLNDPSEGTRNQIESTMSELRSETTGKPVVADILRPEVSEPFMPDFILRPLNGYTFIARSDNLPVFRKIVAARDYHSGTHDLDGMFLLRGKGVEVGGKSPGRIIDIAPTVLYALGLPIPDYMDGNVLTVFTRSFKAAHAPAYSADSVLLEPSPSSIHSYADERAIERNLKELGYL